jgi:hypothetical protein
MEPHYGNQAPHPQRLTPAGVRPLEIWNLPTSAGPLHTCRSLPGYPWLLIEALESLRADRATVAIPFAALVVMGGGLLEPGMRSALEEHFAGSLLVVPDPVFAAATGGLALLGRQNQSGLVADLGQTAIKVIRADDRFLYPRDWQVLPHADEVPAEQHQRQRAALRSFVASALRGHAQPCPKAVVLALPCDFPGEVPGACSYAGLAGDADFVTAVLAQADRAGVACVYLNDAVLAALAARALFRNELPARTLVVTLGFGVGGALLEGEDRDAW